MILGCVPGQELVSEIVGSTPDRVEPEVVLDFVPQVLAETSPAVATGESYQQRPEQAVILIWREVERLILDPDGIPPVEQIAQLTLQSRQAVQARSFFRHNRYCPWSRTTAL